MNTAKYFALLENLSFQHAAVNAKQTAAASQILAENLRQLQKFVQLEIEEQLQELCSEFEVDLKTATIDVKDNINSYIIRLLHVLHTLTHHINFQSDAKEDLISVSHLKLCIQSLQEVSYYALRCQLHKDFYNSKVFQAVESREICVDLLQLSVKCFLKFLEVRQFHIANAMEFVQRDLLAAAVSLQENAVLNETLEYLWQQQSKADFLRHLLLLKATPNLNATLAKQLHRIMLSKLDSPHGFASLQAALHSASPQLTHTRSAEIVANIVAQRGFSAALQQRLIAQILDCCKQQLQQGINLSTAVLSLRRLYDLNAANRLEIAHLLAAHWLPLTAPPELLTGLIIWQQQQLLERLQLWQQLYCSSSVACLPSALLIPYLPLFLQLYEELNDNIKVRECLTDLITRCLDNRQLQQELPDLLQQLYSWQFENNTSFYTLHSRIAVKTQIKIIPTEQQQQQLLPSRSLCQLLMSAENHTLSCNIFLCLLQLMLQQLQQTETTKQTTALLTTEAELADFLQHKYQLQLELLLALEQLVSFEPLKTQLAANKSQQFISLIIDLMQQRLNLNSERTETQQADQLLLVLLMLLLELLESNEQLLLAHKGRKQLQQQLQQLLSNSAVNALAKEAALAVLNLLSGNKTTATATNAAFQRARELLEQQQPHLQVYGIELMLEALKRKDATFISQGHRILALALNTLKSQESYTFLNCVRLFVALVYIMEAEVLELLSAEYLSESLEVDYRLVIGEALIKTAQELGALCYRYKNVLLNCFLHGARSSQVEFRCSSLANLAQLCRLLTQQLHSFFEELLQLINDELSTGSYLPAKRAALLVLSELLAGMESLLDYQEMLLPIYRLLRAIEAAEDCDPQMRQHAANGLKIINEKCRELFSRESTEQLQHEIKVLGIKDTVGAKRKGHILELN